MPYLKGSPEIHSMHEAFRTHLQWRDPPGGKRRADESIAEERPRTPPKPLHTTSSLLPLEGSIVLAHAGTIVKDTILRLKKIVNDRSTYMQVMSNIGLSPTDNKQGYKKKLPWLRLDMVVENIEGRSNLTRWGRGLMRRDNTWHCIWKPTSDGWIRGNITTQDYDCGRTNLSEEPSWHRGYAIMTRMI